MSVKNTRRFIAGAVCPSCHLLDKIVFEKNIDQQSIFCVNCSYSEVKSNHIDDETGANNTKR